MSEQPVRVVFDCVVYVQALISGRGSSGACIDLVKQGGVALVISPYVMVEVRGVPLRPALTKRYHHLTPEFVEAFAKDIERYSVAIENPPHVFSLPRDPKDEPYIDLAVAAGALYLVTWNAKHLTYLMSNDTEEGKEFCARFPLLRILSPPEFLQVARASQTSP